MAEQLVIPAEKAILDALPDAIIWARPVVEGDAVVDFQVEYSNRKADEAINHPKGSLRGLRILRDGIPSAGSEAESNFAHLLMVFSTGKVSDHSFYAVHSNRMFEVNRRKFDNGILSVTRDREAQREAERKQKEHGELLAKLIHTAPVGIVVYEAIRDESNQITDFKCRLFNEEINRLSGISSAERSRLTLRQVLSRAGFEENFYLYTSTVETGKPFSFMLDFKKAGKWMHFFGTRFGDGFISMVTDRTPEIHGELELKRYSQLLDSILNASQNAINTMRAIRNERGDVIDFEYVGINKAFERVTRMLRDDVINHTLLELFPTTLVTGIFDAYRNTLDTGVPSRIQVDYTGEHLDAWYDLSVVKLDDDTVVGTFMDISDLKFAEIQLQRSWDRLSRFINTADTGLGLFQPVFNDDGEIIDFTYGVTNISFASYSGMKPQELEGLRVSSIFPTYMENGNFEKYRHTYLTGESIRFESHYVGDGLNLWFDTTATKMTEGVLLTVNNITEVKLLQLKLERYVEELKRSNANLEAFAYAASHDMKEPIRKINFFTDLLKNEHASSFNTDAKLLFDRLLSASQRMNSLIEDLLSYSSISFDAAANEDVNLAEMVRQVLSDLDVLIEEKRGRVTVGSLPVVSGRPRQLQQLFFNLISNALKYSRKGVPPEVRIESEVQPGHGITAPFPVDTSRKFHMIKVTDNGIGFRAEDSEKIFNVFQRLHGTSEYRGTGIGLAIVRKVCEYHKGYCWAESRVNEGSTFFVLLPVMDGDAG